MYIQNVTFVVIAERENELIEALRSDLIPGWIESSPAASVSRLSRVELPERLVEEDAPVSVTFQMEFSNRNDLDKWRNDVLMPSLSVISDRFGEDVMPLPTVLAEIAL